MSAPTTTFAVADPATLETIEHVPDQGVADAVRAVDRAVGASRTWSRTSPHHRSEVLRPT